MATLPAPIERLIEELIRLPGIGRRGAERIVTHLMEAPPGRADALSRAIGDLRREVRYCRLCHTWSEGETCSICADVSRGSGSICVVERPSDIYAFEASGAFQGRYHVLGGTLSPLRGVTPDKLNVESLVRRAGEESIREIIVATSPTVEGDATALYLAQRLKPLGVEVARIGLGLPLGASLGYADAGTLKLALEGRRKLEG